jgi:hypothetical protein
MLALYLIFHLEFYLIFHLAVCLTYGLTFYFTFDLVFYLRDSDIVADILAGIFLFMLFILTLPA